MDDARTIYERKTGKPLLSYQTPTHECILQGILNYLDDRDPFVEISLPELPTINLDDERIKGGIQETLKHEFRPELLNRIDQVVVFRPLGMEQLKTIAKQQVAILQTRLLQQNLQLKVSPAVVKLVAEKSFDPAQGARFVRRTVQQLLEDPLAERIISGSWKEGTSTLADVKKDVITFSQVKIPKPARVAVTA
jgi:ATP-dependent Clp protease ATP-binding subunit ClpA